MKTMLLQVFIFFFSITTFSQSSAKLVVLNHIESVATDGSYYYVADIGKQLEPSQKDGDGKIYKIPISGGYADSLFSKEVLNSPKGLAVRKKDLFIADIDRIIILNLSNGQLKTEIALTGLSLFLNDIAIADDSILYVSATDKNKIFKVNYQTKQVLELKINQVIQSPNGLYFEAKSNRLFVNGFGSNNQPNGIVGYVEIRNGNFTRLSSLSGYFDGIQVDNNILYLSNWVSFDDKGVIESIDLRDPNTTKIIKTPLLSGPADFVIHKGKIIIPQMLTGILLSIIL